LIPIALLTFALGAAAARAAQPRPWLCRIKPVFSSEHAMRFSAERRGGGRWRLLLMTFDPMGGHDGYTIVESHDLDSAAPSVSGSLAAGRYFAVAQYLEDGEWICPGYAQRSDKYTPGEVASICYGEQDAPDCAVKLTVTSAH
jgi:hypothetical protein